MLRDRVEIAHEALEDVRWPLQRFAWAVEDRVVWPLQDLALGWDRRGRAAMAAGLVLAAGIALAAGALWGGDGSQAKAPQVSAAEALTAKPVKPQPAPEPEGPVLHGAAPVFGASGGVAAGEASKAASAGATSTPTSAPAAAQPQESVAPKSQTAAVLRVARRFAGAFVLYEIGKAEGDASEVFAGTATPGVAKALAERPPRQPSQVDVPKAKVLNVVSGPRRGKRFRSVSVSLLRVGSISELRLDLRRTKAGWLVSDIKG